MLEIRNLRVTYPDGTKAVDGVSFTVEDGESIALVGANGAGKTTLLLSLVGVVQAQGEIRVDGVELTHRALDEIRRRVGLVFQNPDDQLFMPLIREDVAFGPRNFGVPEREVEARVDDVLARLNISHLKLRSPLRLSGGEKRIAAIAAVLAMQPSVLLLDEPTAFLDPRARRALIGLLGTLPQTKLIATHDLSFAAEACGRVVLLKEGRIFADGAPRALLCDAPLMEACGVEAIRLP